MRDDANKSDPEALYLNYAPGVVLEQATQLVQRNAGYFRAANALALPLTLTGDWTSDEPHLEAVEDTSLRQELAAAGGASLVGYQSRTSAAKLSDFPSPLDLGAVGDGVSNDTQYFTALESAAPGALVNLAGRTYLVNALPVRAVYVNGSFSTPSGVVYAPQDAVTIGALSDTGGIEAAYSGGTNGTPTVSGRSTYWNRSIIASTNSRVMFVRGVAAACIYTWVKANVGFAAGARQCVINGPQSSVISGEECRSYGFRATHVGSVFSEAVVSSGGTVWSRLGRVGGSYTGLIGTNTCRIGSGRNGKLALSFTNGQVTGVTVLDPGAGYVVAETKIDIIDRSSFGSGAAVAIEVNGAGSIVQATVTAPGNNYTSPDSVSIELNQYEATSLVLASTLSNVQGALCANAAVVASTASTIQSAAQAAIIASDTCTLSANRTATIASNGCRNTAVGATIISGVNTVAEVEGIIALGRRGKGTVPRSISYADSSSGEASYTNTKFEVTPAGNIRIAGQLTPGSTFTDYGEYFPNLEHGSLQMGTIVALEGHHVRAARAGDRILGVVSATAAVVSGDSPFHYAHKYKLGKFDEPLYQDIRVVSWDALSSFEGEPQHASQIGLEIPPSAVFSTRCGFAEDAETGDSCPIEIDWVSWPAEEGFSGSLDDCEKRGLIPPARASYTTEREQVLNPDYDPNMPHLPRSSRPDEWTLVGILGQVRVRVGPDVSPGQFVAPDGSLSLVETNLQCLRINHAWEEAEGYGVALCLIR